MTDFDFLRDFVLGQATSEKHLPGKHPQKKHAGAPAAGAGESLSPRQQAHVDSVRRGAGGVNEGWSKMDYSGSGLSGKINRSNRAKNGNQAAAFIERSSKTGRYLLEKTSTGDGYVKKTTTQHNSLEEARQSAHEYLTTPLWMPAAVHHRGE
jgi:hypothetical protein